MKLFIVATPIGNLDDVSPRVKQTLVSVDLVAAEDTRHSAILMQHLGIDTPMIAYHDHNEHDASEQLVARMLEGAEVALISDAGTPLISDPGYRLVQLAHQNGIQVIPIPGPSALITALSASGLATDRFQFVGFLPAKSEARDQALQAFATEPMTLVFYESRHRITASLSAMCGAFGADRPAALGRELTKKFEQIKHSTLGKLLEDLQTGEIVSKGEFVVMVAGVPKQKGVYEHRTLMGILLAELPPRRAAAVASQLTGEPKKYFYDLSLELKNQKRD